MNQSFNKSEYDVTFRKNAMKEKKKAQFNTDLDYNEKIELDELLKTEGKTKAQFIRRYKLEEEIKHIISRYGSQQFEHNIDFSKFKKQELKNGLIIALQEIHIINNEYMYWVMVSFNDDILYFGTMSYNYSEDILKKLELLDTSHL